MCMSAANEVVVLCLTASKEEKMFRVVADVTKACIGELCSRPYEREVRREIDVWKDEQVY